MSSERERRLVERVKYLEKTLEETVARFFATDRNGRPLKFQTYFPEEKYEEIIQKQREWDAYDKAYARNHLDKSDFDKSDFNKGD